MRLLCSILACLAIGVRSNFLPQQGRQGTGSNPSTRRISVIKANVIPIHSINPFASSSPRDNQIPLGSPKHQNPGRPQFTVPSVIPTSANAIPSQDRHPAIAFHSSGLSDPSALANQTSPVSFFASIPSHSAQAVPLFIHHAAGTQPTVMAVGPTKDGQIHTSRQSLINDPTFGGPISPITFISPGSSSGAQGSSQLNLPNPVLNPLTASPSGSSLPSNPTGQSQNLPINFPTPSSFPVARSSVGVNRTPFSALVGLTSSGQVNSGGVPVALFGDSPAAFGLPVGDFLPPGFIR